MCVPNGLSRNLCIAVDARKYGSGDDQAQLSIQRLLVQVLDTAAAAAGLHRLSWTRQAGSDSEFAILPPHEPEAVVVDRFVREVAAELRRQNRGRLPEARLRVRMAAYFGRLVPGENGFAGPAPVGVNRLLNSRELRQALDESGSDLAVLLSEHIYLDTVAPLHTTWRPWEFRKVRVQEKEFDQNAWLWVQDGDTAARADEGEPQQPQRPPTDPLAPTPQPQQSVHTTVQQVSSPNVVFGIQNK